ncbi:MAG: LamG domain-containing protein, partial [Planctomycetes bacterium]|nr:LamG domain-containing protein [Planctomycetota bacterium]
YELDQIYQLHSLKMWNNNQGVEPLFGVGAKNVTIQTSLDGVEWSVFGDVEVAQAPGTLDYKGGPPLDMQGVSAQHVRIDIHDNWGSIIAQAGLSEVQLAYTPVVARHENPASLSTNVALDGQLSWRPGRQAGQHQVYFGTDASALTLVDTITEPSMDLSSLDIQLATTYFWRVDEVNDTSASLWTGTVWSFSTPSAISVDDFEGYTKFSPDRPFQTWLDGYGFSGDEFFPQGYEGNGTGAGVGHDIWGLNSPHYDGDIMETGHVRGGRLSLPFNYNNTGAEASQIDRHWSTPQDWSGHGIGTLIVNVYGDPNNTGTSVHVKINDNKVTCPENAALKQADWYQWAIDLASLGIDLSAVTRMSIGVEGVGSGMILVDELSLYRTPPSLITAWYSLENHTNDITGNGHDGVPVGDPVYVPGAEGMGLLFDGTGNQYVDLGRFDPSEGAGQLSVSLWAQWQGLTSFYQGLIGKRDAWATDEMMWHIEADLGTGAIKFQQTAGGVFPGRVLPINEWTHVGVSFDGNVARIYISGIEVGSGVFSFGTDRTASLQFGAVAINGGNPFNGALDEIKLYNRALSEAEMQTLAGL